MIDLMIYWNENVNGDFLIFIIIVIIQVINNNSCNLRMYQELYIVNLLMCLC